MLPAAYIAGSVTLLVALCVGWSTSNRVQTDDEGWASISLGPLGYGAATGAAAFSLVLFYVWLFVGSSRDNAATQMLYCLLTALASMIFSLIILMSGWWRRVHWRDGILRVRPLVGSEAFYDFDALESVAVRETTLDFFLHFRGRKPVKISPIMTGLRELLLSLGNPPVRHI